MGYTPPAPPTRPNPMTPDFGLEGFQECHGRYVENGKKCKVCKQRVQPPTDSTCIHGNYKGLMCLGCDTHQVDAAEPPVREEDSLRYQDAKFWLDRGYPEIAHNPTRYPIDPFETDPRQRAKQAAEAAGSVENEARQLLAAVDHLRKRVAAK